VTNPYPGMNPFIEANGRWKDFHMTFLTTCREQLITRLPAHYRARLNERVQLIDQGDHSFASYRPDVSVVRTTRASDESGGVATLIDLEPVICRNMEVETESVGYIEIHTASNDQLVTVIEVMSPTNKKEPGRAEYRSKMEQLRRSGVHAVEIDLLLGGERLNMRELLPIGDFYTFVTRKEFYPRCEVYAWSIRRKLPRIPIPLNQPDKDVVMDLAAAFETTFQRGGYGEDLDYNVPLPESLDAADREWAASFVKSAET
jgi:hypothetical protein